jgi:hypothetical protein
VKLFQPDLWRTYGESFDLRKLSFVDFSIHLSPAKDGLIHATMLVAGVLQVSSDIPHEQGEHYFLLDEVHDELLFSDVEHAFLRLHHKWRTALSFAMSVGVVWVNADSLGHVFLARFQHLSAVAVPSAKSRIYRYRVASCVTEQQRVWIPAGSWGQDSTQSNQPLITDSFVGGSDINGSWIHDMCSAAKTNSRRDALAQLVICRTSWLGKHVLAAA